MTPQPHHFLLIPILVVSSILAGCVKQPPPEPEVDIWTQEEVRKVLSKTRWRCEKVYRITGQTKIDLDNDPSFQDRFFEERKSLLFSFYSTQVMVLYATPITLPEGKFRPGAEGFIFTDRAIRPTNMSSAWDDELNTLVVWSEGEFGTVVAPAPFKAFLDKSSIVKYDSYQEEERATIPSNLTFKAEAGGSTYLFHLKPVWYYETDLISTHTYRYVVFP